MQIKARILNILRSLAKTEKILSWRASLKEKQRIKIYFDGTDWVETWEGGVIVRPFPVLNPIEQSKYNLDLFTKHYQLLPGDIVVDVGAGCGDELCFFSKRVHQEGRVIAIEASSDCIRRIYKVAKIASIENVTIIHSAIGSHEGIAKITTESPDSIRDRIIAQENSVKGQNVDLTTMDAIIAKLDIQKIDFLKVNIEGAEIDLLKGFEKHWRKVQNFCISCHDFVSPEQRTYDAVRRWFFERGISLMSYTPTDCARAWRNYYVYASISGMF